MKKGILINLMLLTFFIFNDENKVFAEDGSILFTNQYVSGYVLDSTTHNPMPGVRVSLWENYRISTLETCDSPEEYNCYASYPDFTFTHPLQTDVPFYFGACTDENGFFEINVDCYFESNDYHPQNVDQSGEHEHIINRRAFLRNTFSPNNVGMDFGNGLRQTSKSGTTIYVTPINLYNNQVEIPLPYLNTHVKYGYQKLDKYFHNVIQTIGGNTYNVTGALPTITLTPGLNQLGKINFNFSVSAKCGTTPMGNGTALLSVSPTVIINNGKLSLAIVCSDANLTITGFPNYTQHIANIKTIINNKLTPNPIFLAPIAFGGDVYSKTIQNPAMTINVWNMTACSGIEVTSTPSIIVKLVSGWYIY